MFDSIIFWIMAFIGVFLTGIAKSGFAGSTGVIAVPLMAIAIDPKIAAALMLPLLIFMDFFNIKTYSGQQHRSLLKYLMLGSILGVFAGMLSFNFLPSYIIGLLIGIVSGFFGLRNLKKQAITITKKTNAASYIIGTISGFTSFIAHAGGPPVNGYLLSRNLTKNQLLATATIFLAMTNLIKLPAYAAINQLNLTIGYFSVLLLPVAYLGVKAGIYIKDKIDQNSYILYLNILVILVSIYLILINLYHWIITIL